LPLPPKTSTLWDQMEEDIAAERWPLPHELPASFILWEPHDGTERRALFRARLGERFRLRWLAWVVAAQIPLFLILGFVGLSEALCALVICVSLAQLLHYVIEARQFDRAVRNYLLKQAGPTA